MGNKKILFVSGSLNRGGAQRVITLIAEDYVKKGWDVHIAVLLESKIGYKIDERITVHDVVRRGNHVVNTFGWIRDLRKIVRDSAPQVIVSFVGRINMITMLAAHRTGIPVLISERNDPARDRRSKPELWLCKRFYQKADRVIFQTDYQAKYYEKWCGKNSIIIGNPISAPVYEGEHFKKDIVCVGKLMSQKNHPMMIKAFKQIAEEFPEKRVYIYGEGTKRQELEALVKEYDLEGRVFLPGNSDHIFDVMHQCEYFVMCSDYEGLSNALLEGMISGMICITTTWSGVEDIVTDGVNGYLVPIGDEKALADKLRDVLMADNEIVRKCSIETGKRYMSGRIISQWCQEIENLVKG